MKMLQNYLADWLDSLCMNRTKLLPMESQFLAEPSVYNLPDWIDHILTYSQVSPSCIIQGCILLSRIKKEYPALQFSHFNIRRLILIATMEIAKLNEDVAYMNKDWVWISDNVFTCITMNRMEREFLSLIHYRVFVGVDEYNDFCLMLMERFHISFLINADEPNLFFNPLISSETFVSFVEDKKLVEDTSTPLPPPPPTSPLTVSESQNENEHLKPQNPLPPVTSTSLTKLPLSLPPPLNRALHRRSSSISSFFSHNHEKRKLGAESSDIKSEGALTSAHSSVSEFDRGKIETERETETETETENSSSPASSLQTEKYSCVHHSPCPYTCPMSLSFNLQRRWRLSPLLPRNKYNAGNSMNASVMLSE